MAHRLDNPASDLAKPRPTTVSPQALKGLIGSVTQALLLRPHRKAAFIAELRRAQKDVDALMGHSGAALSPSCRHLLLRLSTELERRVMAVSTRAQRQVVRDRLAEHRAAIGSPKVRSP